MRKTVDRCKVKLKKLLQNTSVELEEISTNEYSVKFEGRQWLVWPLTDKYIELQGDEPCGDMFFVSPNDFYEIHISRKLQAPKNFGKVWRPDEDELLLEMYALGETANKMAQVLERQPTSVVYRLGKLIEMDVRKVYQSEHLLDVNLYFYLTGMETPRSQMF